MSIWISCQQSLEQTRKSSCDTRKHCNLVKSVNEGSGTWSIPSQSTFQRGDETTFTHVPRKKTLTTEIVNIHGKLSSFILVGEYYNGRVALESKYKTFWYFESNVRGTWNENDPGCASVSMGSDKDSLGQFQSGLKIGPSHLMSSSFRCSALGWGLCFTPQCKGVCHWIDAYLPPACDLLLPRGLKSRLSWLKDSVAHPFPGMCGIVQCNNVWATNRQKARLQPTIHLHFWKAIEVRRGECRDSMTDETSFTRLILAQAGIQENWVKARHVLLILMK